MYADDSWIHVQVPDPFIGPLGTFANDRQKVGISGEKGKDSKGNERKIVFGKRHPCEMSH